MIQSYGFYISENWAPGRQPILLPNGRTVYIRPEKLEGDELEALRNVRPEIDESVMNTHQFPYPEVE